MKQRIILTIAGILSIALGFTVTTWFRSNNPTIAHGNWISSATRVADVADEADVIAHIQVQKVLTTQKLKEIDHVGDKAIPNITPFTKSELKVIKVYKGSVDRSITILQTGGKLPASDGDPAINIQLDDDPIFTKGEEYILFLKDISADTIHGKEGHKLYRIVNPAGRYLIRGTQVYTYRFVDSSQPSIEITTQPTAAPPSLPTVAPASKLADESLDTTIPSQPMQEIVLPATLDDLLNQIKQAEIDR
jgi:hypothetical protein